MTIGVNGIKQVHSEITAPSSARGSAIDADEYQRLATAFARNAGGLTVFGRTLIDQRSSFLADIVDTNPALVEALRTNRDWPDYVGMRVSDQRDGANLARRAEKQRDAMGLPAGDIKVQRSDVMGPVSTAARGLRAAAIADAEKMDTQGSPTFGRVFRMCVDEQLSSKAGQDAIRSLEAAGIPNARETLLREILKQ